jgi:hypothetical protein
MGRDWPVKPTIQELSGFVPFGVTLGLYWLWAIFQEANSGFRQDAKFKLDTVPPSDARLPIWAHAIGYITPKDMLAGRQREINVTRDRKLAAARQQRQLRRQQAA